MHAEITDTPGLTTFSAADPDDDRIGVGDVMDMGRREHGTREMRNGLTTAARTTRTTKTGMAALKIRVERRS